MLEIYYGTLEKKLNFLVVLPEEKGLIECQISEIIVKNPHFSQ